MKDWSRTAEQIMLAAVEGKIRLLGITSPVSGSGTSTVARGVAEAYARSGHKALLLDLTANVRRDARPPRWVPGGQSAAAAVDVEPTGLAVLTADATLATKALFNNVDFLQQTLGTELSGYTAVVMDLPAVREDEDNRLNPLAAARVADAVLMVCLTGQIDRTQLGNAVETLKMAGANLAGVVLNDYFGTTFGDEVAEHLDGRSLLVPGLSRKLAKMARSSRFLTEAFPYFR